MHPGIAVVVAVVVVTDAVVEAVVVVPMICYVCYYSKRDKMLHNQILKES